MNRLAFSITCLVGFAVAGSAAAAGSAPVAKPALHDSVDQPSSDTSGYVQFGRTLPGRQRLLVTFTDRPSLPEARERLEGLGDVSPTGAEAGVFAISATDPDNVRDRALHRAGVEAAEWALERRAAAEPAGALPVALLPVADPTDPLYPSQWSLRPERLWKPLLTGTDLRPRIAILDGGVDVDHPEWAGTPSPLVDPYSTYRDLPEADDWGRSGHGTHVAGIAAAPANGVGVVGAAPARAGSAEVIPIQIADRDGRSTDETMIAGIRWAVRHRAKVINISAGGPGFSRAFQRTVDWAFSNGALIVASVGNEGDDSNVLNYPAAYAHVIGVGAHCNDTGGPPDCPEPFGLATFTNHNRSLDVLGPGTEILSSVPTSVSEGSTEPGYALKDGTSMAAPFVAGVAALVFGAHPEASPYQVMRQIQNTATDLGAPGRDDETGYGIVNPEAAVTYPLPADDGKEANDEVSQAAKQASLHSAGSPTIVTARVDRLDDAEDVYPVDLRAGQTVRASVTFKKGFVNLYLWQPGTRTVSTRVPGNVRRNLVAYSGVLGAKRQVISVKAPRSGRYYLNVFARRGDSPYTLTLTTK
jgi:Subtilase family